MHYVNELNNIICGITYTECQWSDVDPKETADMFFSGLVLAEMPNHLPSHLQKHVWIGEEELQGTSIENFRKRPHCQC